MWGGSERNRKIHWVAWANICKEKSEGGLGLKNLKAFNYALLGKWLWRLMSEENCLWKKVLMEKYGVEGEVLKLVARSDSIWVRDLRKIEYDGNIMVSS